MSQHIVTTNMGTKTVHLRMGWDHALRQYFYNLTDLSLNCSISSSLNMADDDLQDIDGILYELKQLGVVPPEKMVEEVQIDEVNREGNRVVNYDLL